METETRKILEELRTIRIDIEFIKENMIDRDCVLTSNEKERFDKSVEELKNGQTISLEDL